MVFSSRYSDVLVVYYGAINTDVIDVTLYVTSYLEHLISRIFNNNRFLFAFTSVVCLTFNFNEKIVVSAGFNTIY